MIARGEVTNVSTGNTSKGKPFQTITILEREGGDTRLLRVKDYGCKLSVEKGEHVEINVWATAYQSERGAGINIIASNAQPVASSGKARPALAAAGKSGVLG